MPSKMYRKKRRRKRRRKPKTQLVRRLPLRVGGFPLKMYAKLRYVQTFTLDAGAGTFAANIFRANSVYDPDSSGAGHQPSNYDKLSAIYDTYAVVGSRCKVYPVPISSSSSNPPPVLAICLSEGGNDISTAHATGGIDNVLEQPTIQRTTQYVNGGANVSVPMLTSYFSAKKFFGTTNLTNYPYSSDVKSNPTEGAFYEIAAISPDNSANPAITTFRVEIEYTALFSEPQISDGS